MFVPIYTLVVYWRKQILWPFFFAKRICSQHWMDIACCAYETTAWNRLARLVAWKAGKFTKIVYSFGEQSCFKSESARKKLCSHAKNKPRYLTVVYHAVKSCGQERFSSKNKKSRNGECKTAIELGWAFILQTPLFYIFDQGIVEGALKKACCKK